MHRLRASMLTLMLYGVTLPCAALPLAPPVDIHGGQSFAQAAAATPAAVAPQAHSRVVEPDRAALLALGLALLGLARRRG